MQTSPDSPGSHTSSTPGKRILTITLGCCAGMVVLILLACATAGGIWLLAQSGGNRGAEISGIRKSTIPDSTLEGNVEAGEQIFNQDGNCTACHIISSDARLVGPSLKGLASRSGERVAGLSAAEYLYESIVDPDAYIVDGYQPGIMPAAIGQSLSKQQLADLIVYLLGK